MPPFLASLLVWLLSLLLLAGSFFMLAGANRREMHTLVDHLVYAGFVGFGFAPFPPPRCQFAARSESRIDASRTAGIGHGFTPFTSTASCESIGANLTNAAKSSHEKSTPSMSRFLPAMNRSYRMASRY